MNKELKEAARLLEVSVESLLNFSQDTLNAMEAIMLMYDMKDEKTVMHIGNQTNCGEKKSYKML